MGLSSAWADDNCALTPAEDQAFSVMSFNDFDQTPIGWRRIAKMGCYHQAALLIDKYIAQHRAALQDWQLLDVTWHAGQMYAFNNEYDVAKDRFKAAINPSEPKNTTILWNAYVNASIAFLDRNMAQLQYYRAEIDAGPLYNGKKANLDVVDQLILNFDKPYSVAYCKAQ